MISFTLVNLSGLALPLEVRPGWGLSEAHERGGAAHRARTGALHACGWGAHVRITVPLAYLDAGARETLAAWWRGQARLAWVRAEGGRYRTSVVRAAGASPPLPRRLPPAGERCAGAITLLGERAGATPLRGAPLVLDHATFGTLDTHNLLL
jgi:hypothetical protein